MSLRNALGRVHRLLGRTRVAARIAVKVRNQANALVSAHFSGIEEPARNGEYALINRVAPGASTFIDVGANVGDWSARFVSRMGAGCRGLLVDANAACIAKLRGRFGQSAGLSVLEAAMSDYCGTATFYEGSGVESALSSLSGAVGAERAMAPRTVAVTTLDREVERLGWDRVSMLKIDAEGHDFFVLRGARILLAARRIDCIQFECNSSWDAVGVGIVAAVRFLEEMGYAAYQLQPDGLRVVDTAYYRDCGSANWVALHARSPDFGLAIRREEAGE